VAGNAAAAVIVEMDVLFTPLAERRERKVPSRPPSATDRLAHHCVSIETPGLSLQTTPIQSAFDI